MFLKGCDVLNFEIEVIFLIKPFFLHDQKVKPKFKYLENERSLKSKEDEIKSILHDFKRAFIKANNNFFLEGESPTLIHKFYIDYQ